MTGPALRVLHGGGPSPLSRTHAVPRLRPGERPVAVDLQLTTAETKTLRARAAKLGLGVDAFVAIFLEYQSICELVGAPRLADIASHDETPSSEAVEPIVALELRAWHRLITGRSTPPDDDLPTVHVPLRLAAALVPTARAVSVMRVLDTPDVDVRRAVALEAAATAHGFVMQAWVLWRVSVGASGGAAAAF